MGLSSNDQGRGGAWGPWPVPYASGSQYPWVGLEGYMAQAHILERAGYAALTCCDSAPERAVDYQYYLYQVSGDTRWWDRTYWVQYMTNYLYGANYPIWDIATPGHIFGFTDWMFGR